MFRSAEAVTPHDTNDTVSGTTDALWVGGAGNLSVVMQGGQTVTFTGVPAGTQLDIHVSRVRGTGTTATSIVALYGVG
jgi:hypothetical protein